MNDDEQVVLPGGDAVAVEVADAELLAELRAIVAAADPVPEAVLAGAQGSLTWLAVDAELAALLEDSSADLVGHSARSVALDVRLLTFDSGDLTIELEVGATGLRRRLTGQVVPAGPAEVRVRRPGGVTLVEADALGRFVVDDVEAGWVSLVVERPGHRPVVTSWTAV